MDYIGGITKGIATFSSWYQKEEEVMNTKDRFMIRGGGLLWIALFIGFLISYVAILITMLNLIIESVLNLVEI
jgi:hypothetical protein